MTRKKTRTVENTITPEMVKKSNQTKREPVEAKKPAVTKKEAVAKPVYSCGCPVIAINATRNKPKCKKHGVA